MRKKVKISPSWLVGTLEHRFRLGGLGACFGTEEWEEFIFKILSSLVKLFNFSIIYNHFNLYMNTIINICTYVKCIQVYVGVCKLYTSVFKYITIIVNHSCSSCSSDKILSLLICSVARWWRRISCWFSVSNSWQEVCNWS